jgi:FkbM family methyltransferase
VDRLFFLGTYERLALSDVLGLVRPGDLVVDIGANVGIYSLASAARGARVVAFEPVPSTASRFERSLALNDFKEGVSLKRVAVSDRSGELTLVAESMAEYSGHASAHRSPGEGTEAVTVPTARLDDALSGEEQQIRVIKADVEGHEQAVFDGAADVFERLSPEYLLVELAGDLLREAGSSANQLFREICHLGYEALGGYDLTHGLWPQTEPASIHPPLPDTFGQTILFKRFSPSTNPSLPPAAKSRSDEGP